MGQRQPCSPLFPIAFRIVLRVALNMTVSGADVSSDIAWNILVVNENAANCPLSQWHDLHPKLHNLLTNCTREFGLEQTEATVSLE